MRDETSFLPMPRSGVHQGRIAEPTGGEIAAEIIELQLAGASPTGLNR